MKRAVCGEPRPRLGTPTCGHDPKHPTWWGTKMCRDAGKHIAHGRHQRGATDGTKGAGT